MQLTQIEDLVHAAFAVDQTCTDRVALDLALSAQARLEAVVAGQRICLARALARLSVTPEADLAAATRSDRREAKRAFERGTVADAAPGFNQALNDGAIRPEHVDRLSGALGRLTLQQGDRLLEQPDLVDAAAAMSPEDFDRELKRRERALSNDDGQALFERQKRATRLDTWIDDDGMANWKLRVDPLTGVLLTILIRANAEAMFHSGQVPDGAPVLPRDRQAFVHAHALIGLLFGDGPKPKTGVPEVVVVVDTRVPAGAEPVIDWGLPVILPKQAVVDLVQRGNVFTVAFDGDQVVSAPGRLDVGRESRLATPAQRRALRALYATCAVPGCVARFEHTDAHHISEWHPHGLTNLDNLLPLCWRHHRDVHQQGWRLTLTPGCRQLTIQLPDGTVLRGRPNRAEHTAMQASGP